LSSTTLNVHHASDDVGFDSALVGSTEDLEVAVISPVGVPGVGDEPIGSRVLDAPPEDADSVTAEHAAGLVLVNA